MVDPVIIQINETQIRLSHIVKSMRATNKDTLHDLFTQRGLVFQIVQREKIKIPRDELQKGIDQWRYKNRLDERTRPVSGYLGRQSRRDLPNDVAPLLFAAEVGKVIGPIKMETGYALYYIQQHCPAVLDEATKARCVQELYQRRLRREAKRSHISYPFLESICTEDPLPNPL